MRLSRFLTLLAAGVIGFAGQANAQTTVTFQQGVNGYNGCFDRLINITDGGVDGSGVDTATTAYFIDGDPTDGSRGDYLIRFDNILGGQGTIPAGAIILEATLTLTTTDNIVSGNSQSGESYNVYRLTQAFDSNSTLDGDFGDGSGDFTANVDGVEPEDLECDYNLGTFDREFNVSSLMDINDPISADVTRAVQSWVDGDPNLGFAVMSDHVDNDDGWSVHSTGSSVTARRPLLTVTYTLDPLVQVLEFQQGLNEYQGTTDLFLPQEDFSVDGSTISEGFVDGDDGVPEGSNDDIYMVKFDISAAEAVNIDEVIKAELIFKTGISSGASDSRGNAFWACSQMLVPFVVDPDPLVQSQWFNFGGTYPDMITNGDIDPAVDFYFDIDEAELVKADVTDIVKNWLEDGETNHGFYIGSFNTENGWQIFSSGAVDQDLAPMLRIYLKEQSASFLLGDMNNNMILDFNDIEPFVLALFDRAAYEAMFPGVDADERGDVNDDGVLDFNDIEPFVNLLFGN